jgi:hypothetical protein
MSGGGGGDGGRGPRPPGWWQAARGAGSLLDLLNRWSSPLALAGVGLAASGCAEILAEAHADEDPEENPDDGRPALDEQQLSGWNVGSEGDSLDFVGAQASDVSGRDGWRDAMPGLALSLAPGSARWDPFYGPALFQSLEAPRNYDLRIAMRPVYTREMALAFRRGEALLSLLMQDGACRRDVALVLDLDGPESVALAAALASCFDPVFAFANWPHPAGVVPAHLTLGAALYFLPAFQRARGGRTGEAPPAFVLDRQRLAPYVDEAEAFDNRYTVGLPPPGALAAAGISRVLYVTPDDGVTHELDDLNDDLVAIDRGGIGVQLLSLSDFSETPLPGWTPFDPCASNAPAPAGTPGGPPPLYFGGSPASHACFAEWYGWLDANWPSGRFTSSTSYALPAALAPRCHFRLAPRFVLHGVPPGGHGRHAMSTSASSAHFGGGFHRSGSFGRIHGGGFG